MIPTNGQWLPVVFSSDCDEDGNCPRCSIDYVECPCPGPTEDGVSYRVHNDILEGCRGVPHPGTYLNLDGDRILKLWTAPARKE